VGLASLDTAAPADTDFLYFMTRDTPEAALLRTDEFLMAAGSTP
jgi:hypothetical protein